MKSKLIIVEGPRGTGKTTVTNWLREQMPSTNLYRLSGNNDKTSRGKVKAERMYEALVKYMKSLEHQGISLVFDRIWISEEVFCRLGKKEYQFTDVFNLLNYKLAYMEFDIYIIGLTANPNTIYTRLQRDKADYQGDGFNMDVIMKEMDTYIEALDDIGRKYPWLNVRLINTDTDHWMTNLSANLRI